MKWILPLLLAGCINGGTVNIKANPDGSFEVGGGLTVEPKFNEKWKP